MNEIGRRLRLKSKKQTKNMDGMKKIAELKFYGCDREFARVKIVEWLRRQEEIISKWNTSPEYKATCTIYWNESDNDAANPVFRGDPKSKKYRNIDGIACYQYDITEEEERS